MGDGGLLFVASLKHKQKVGKINDSTLYHLSHQGAQD